MKYLIQGHLQVWMGGGHCVQPPPLTLDLSSRFQKEGGKRGKDLRKGNYKKNLIFLFNVCNSLRGGGEFLLVAPPLPVKTFGTENSTFYIGSHYNVNIFFIKYLY